MRLITFWATSGPASLSMIAGCGGDGDGPTSPDRLAVPAGVWTVSASTGAVLRLTPDELSGTGGKEPATLITTPSARVQVTGQRFLWSAAFWPILAGLPLR